MSDTTAVERTEQPIVLTPAEKIANLTKEYQQLGRKLSEKGLKEQELGRHNFLSELAKKGAFEQHMPVDQRWVIVEASMIAERGIELSEEEKLQKAARYRNLNKKSTAVGLTPEEVAELKGLEVFAQQGSFENTANLKKSTQ